MQNSFQSILDAAVWHLQKLQWHWIGHRCAHHLIHSGLVYESKVRPKNVQCKASFKQNRKKKITVRGWEYGNILHAKIFHWSITSNLNSLKTWKTRWIMFSLKSNHTSVCLVVSWDRLFFPAHACDYCVHTCPNKVFQKQTRVQFKYATYCIHILWMQP